MSCWSSFWFWGVLTAVIAWGTLHLRKPNPPKIFGVYSQPGTFYWLKVVAFYILAKFRQWQTARNEGNETKGGWEEIDKVQALSESQVLDAVYFSGANSEGFRLSSLVNRKLLGGVNGFLIFRIPDLGTLVTPKFPDTILFGGSDEHFEAEGIKYYPVVPMRHWRLAYDGNLKLYGEDLKLYRVKLRADWTSNLTIFDMNSMLPPWTTARSIARETWSREYFETSQHSQMSHYEQPGSLKGEIEVDGNKYSFNMPSLRSHSYGGKPNSNFRHRKMVEMFSLKDGRRFTVGNVSYPATCSELEYGYMYEADGSLHVIERVSPHLWSFGENGVPPTDYALHVRATNGKEYAIQVQVLDSQEFFTGPELEARIIERRAKFTVDGVQGFGISECLYRNTTWRPEVIAQNDPEWVKSNNP